MTTTRKLLWWGGVAAGALLVILGAFWIYAGVNARSEVHDTITQEQIVGSPDMSPTAILAGIKEAGLEGKVSVPDCSVADQTVTSGDQARCFAEYMRVHALESTGGRTYSEMGRFLDANGKEVFTEEDAATGANGRPVSQPGARPLGLPAGPGDRPRARVRRRAGVALLHRHRGRLRHHRRRLPGDGARRRHPREPVRQDGGVRAARVLTIGALRRVPRPSGRRGARRRSGATCLDGILRPGPPILRRPRPARS